MIRLERAAVAAVLTSFFCFPLYVLSNAGGPPPGRTGGPFPGEQSCAIAGCHAGGGPNNGPGGVTITINGGPAGDFRYTPGEPAMIEVRVEDPNQQRWGFQLTARKGGGCEGAGMFSANPDETQVSFSNTRRIAECGSANLPIAQHAFPKGDAGGATFRVNWTPNDDDAGPITLAAAGNAANGNGTNSGDSIYTTSVVIEPAEVVNPDPTPSITENGAVLATQTPVIPTGSASSILSVFGSDFAAEGTQAFQAEVDAEGNVTTELANTCVEVNGRPSPVFAVTPTQVNFQADEQTEMGPAMVQVVRDCGEPVESRSNMVAINFDAASPGFFNFVNNADGVNPIAAVSEDSTAEVFRIGPAGLFNENPPTRPAQPGEVVSLFATGFGETSPAFAAGEIPSAENPDNPIARVTGPVSVSLGDIVLAEADVLYAGVSPCCAGLYQLTIRVPETTPDGDHEVIVTINGFSSPAGPFLAVAAE